MLKMTSYEVDFLNKSLKKIKKLNFASFDAALKWARRTKQLDDWDESSQWADCFIGNKNACNVSFTIVPRTNGFYKPYGRVEFWECGMKLCEIVL